MKRLRPQVAAIFDLDRTLIATLSAPDWLKNARTTIITGPTGVGKSWIACALGHRACRNDIAVIYHRAARLFEELALAHGDGRHAKPCLLASAEGGRIGCHRR